ncbi:integral membrane protein [Rutstroemia sp. NJR-2017a WRK4]|nr:integral membrane protein [Rutstroemia sp. NJR-2017a WRK4]
MFGLNAFWGFAYFMVYLLRCIPISDAWSIPNGEPRHCIPNNDAEYSYAVTNVLLDAAILSMPAPMIWKLKLPTRQKIAVCGIFLLGIIPESIIGSIRSAISLHTRNSAETANSDRSKPHGDSTVGFAKIPDQHPASIDATVVPGKSNWVEMKNVAANQTTCESDPEMGR